MGTYSGGERRRLEIARALVSEPRVLFLDEPTVGLDPRIRHELLDVIAGLRARSEMTILLTTHYLDEAQRLCDRVAIMNRGEIAALDAPGALLAGLGGEILEMRLDGDAAAALATLRAHGIATADVFTVGSTVTLPLRRTSAAEAIAAIHATDVRASGITTRSADPRRRLPAPHRQPHGRGGLTRTLKGPAACPPPPRSCRSPSGAPPSPPATRARSPSRCSRRSSSPSSSPRR